MSPPDPSRPPEPALDPATAEPQDTYSEQRIEAPPAPPPPGTPHEPQPFWNYQDVLLFLAFALPSLIVAVLVVQLIPPTRLFGRAFQALLAQLIWYALVFGALYVMLRARYGQPFWPSLGWRFPFRGMPGIVFGGPVLAIAIGYAGYLLHTPNVQTPFQQMLSNRPTVVLFALFAVVVGPLCEELAFRGFLMPLLVRSFGALIGIVATGALFGLLHAPEYSWSWRHVLLITAAGSAFGWVRYKTASTAASTFMHSAYNLTQFAAFLTQAQ
ncbi:MAG TPA: type II CAAX endopeptidase family protein [Bryobacteraceae bacterium]|nr:type II CAAX endopeptidase family protein [Bryobacteraceae bacterium]